MTIFDQLFDIITSKQNKLSLDVESEKEFLPFLAQRWISFYSNDFAHLVNNSTNFLWRGIPNKQVWYKFFSGVLPTSRQKRIKYIKKSKDKEKVEKNKELVEYLANSYEISQREVEYYIKEGIIDVKGIKKQIDEK